eukprot:1155815-Pelagomonas_calceolata.AAC.5
MQEASRRVPLEKEQSNFEVQVGDNRLDMREYGGTEVKMQFINQLSRRRVRERCCACIEGQLNTKHHIHMALEHAKVTSQLLQWGDANVLEQSSNGNILRIPSANRPTPPNRPFVVRYSLANALGFTVQPALRLVHFDCSETFTRIYTLVVFQTTGSFLLPTRRASANVRTKVQTGQKTSAAPLVAYVSGMASKGFQRVGCAAWQTACHEYQTELLLSGVGHIFMHHWNAIAS